MAPDDPVGELAQLARVFGRAAARRKSELLAELGRRGQLGAAELLALQSTLSFLRAYPDDTTVRRQVHELTGTLRRTVTGLTGRAEHRALRNSGLPGAVHGYPYHYGVLRELTRAFPGCVEVDWPAVPDEAPLLDALRLVLPPVEVDGLEDERLSLADWFAQGAARKRRTDLEILLGELERAPHAEAVVAQLYDRGDVPVCYRLDRPGTGRLEIALPTERICYQRRALEREHFDLEPIIRRPLPVPRPLARRAGEQVVRVALAALCSRNLEIYPLIYANPRDVTRVPCGRGVEVVLIGIRPEFRAPLETISFYLIAKNGVPLAYGPAGVFLGACEMGINLFPEFRGGEIRFIYASLMRVLRHAFAVEYYYLLPYGMGEGNPEAIASAAFWFYRKLGFSADNPQVEALAQAEEARMAAQPGHRSSVAMLRRLSHTRVSYDLSGGRSAPFDFGALGNAVTCAVGRRYAGNRDRAATACTAWLCRTLPIGDRSRWSRDERRALRSLAPLLSLVPRLAGWPRAERASLLRAVRAKGRPAEAPAARALAQHPRLGPALRQLASTWP